MRQIYAAVIFVVLISGCTTDEQRDQESADIRSRACHNGDAEQCLSLANSYHLGWWTLGTDPERAAALYRQACNGDFAEGCRRLGIYFEAGRHAPVNLDLAHDLYRQACGLSDGIGCFRLAQMYESSSGVALDYQRAASLYLKACDLEHLASCSRLAYFYENEIGVDQSFVRAYVLYIISGNWISYPRSDRIERVGDKLTEDERAEARRITFRCRRDSIETCLR